MNDIAQAIKERRFQLTAIPTATDLVPMLLGRMRVIDGLPDDAIVHRLFYEPERDALMLCLASMTFSPVDRGSCIPEISLTCRLEVEG